MKKLIYWLALAVCSFAFASCEKNNDKDDDGYTYYLVGFHSEYADWRDTGFVVRTSNPQMILKADEQLALPTTQRKLVFGKLLPGNGGYNKNGSHPFKWHFKEDEWDFVDVTAEIYDGRAYSDVDTDTSYWLSPAMGRYGSWDS